MSKPSYASMLGIVFMACALTVDAYAASQEASATSLQAIPTYENCSLYLNGSQAAPGGLGVRYRTAAGGAWQDGHPLVVSATDPVPRGSLFGLAAGTAYEAEILRPDGTRLAAATFSTWAEQVPIARSISLDAHESAGGPLLIEQGGTPEGWIRYIAPPGFVIDGGERDTEAVLLRNAAYVILEGLTVRGGQRHGIRLSKCHDVRISGCDISGFGRVGVQDLAKDGKYYDAKGAAINYDAGICIEDSGRLTIERNWIHDPRSHANSWFFSHPAGPTAMFTRATGEVVVRWNDFVGSDRHRWNDVMEGWGNSKREGAFNRDSDIHGNYLAFANDDAIELDGGQCNVRFYGNLIQGTMCGVSTAPNLRGPSWVFANVIANLADERGLGSAGIKNGGGSTHSAGTTFFYHNTFAGQGSGISAVGFGNDRDRGLFRAVGRNNLFAITGCGIQDPYMPEGTSYDGDVFAMPWSAPGLRVTARPCGPASVEAPAALAAAADGDYRPGAGSPAIGRALPIPGLAGLGRDSGALPADGARTVPWRPEGLRALPAELRFHGLLAEQPVREVEVTSTVRQAFSVRMNAACDWLRVEPLSGSVGPGEPARLRVSLDARVMQHGGSVPGAFLVRLASGASVPVTVMADIATVACEIAAEAEALPGADAFAASQDPGASGARYLDFVGASKEAGAIGIDFAFDIPADASYAISLRVRCPLPVPEHDSVWLALDGGPPQQCPVSGGPGWQWVSRTGRDGVRLPLTAGRHVLRVIPRERLDLDAIRIGALPIPLHGRGAPLAAAPAP